MSVGKHTPGPWVVSQTRHTSSGQFRRVEAIINVGPTENCGNTIAIVHMGGLGAASNRAEDVIANAERIVQCVNAHDDLVEALRDMLAEDNHHHREKARAALEAACR